MPNAVGWSILTATHSGTVVLEPALDIVLLLGQCVLTWLIALWLALGALENIRHPAANGGLVADVMCMGRMRETYPEFFEIFGGNRVESAWAHKLAFWFIVIVETAVALLLLVGAGALTLALFGGVPGETARILAALGALGFAAIWGGFLVGGQWFHYWCGHEGSQMTHLVATLWGIVTFLVLML